MAPTKQKSPKVLANAQLFEFLKKVVSGEVDKALEISNKRRKEFKKQFQEGSTLREIDKLDLSKKPLKIDKDNSNDPLTSPSSAPTEPSGASTNPLDGGGGTNASPDGLDASNGAPGETGGVSAGDGSVDPTTGLPTDPNSASPDGTDPLAGPEGGMGGGYGGSGGGGGGGGASDGMTSDATGEEEEASQKDETEEEPQGDPVVNLVKSAQELANVTQDPGLILKSLKSQIQVAFAKPEHAMGLVFALMDTKDPLLASVAERLYLFMKVGNP